MISEWDKLHPESRSEDGTANAVLFPGTVVWRCMLLTQKE